MKVRAEVTAEKLRGGFYTPEKLVQFALQRLTPLLPRDRRLEILEPSAGDGAFVRGIASHSQLADRVEHVLAVEALELEAEKCRRCLGATSLSGSVVVDSAINWSIGTPSEFDAAVGNPPFVRYQFISALDKAQIPALGAEAGGFSFAGVSNLWLPVLVAALSRLKLGGAFSFVVPTELLTGMSAARFRRWLLSSFSDLRIDLFSPGSFPQVLQEVAVLSGRRAVAATADSRLTIGEHQGTGQELVWTNRVDPDETNWTRYLLRPSHLEALEEALSCSAVSPLNSLARFQVSIVTGANDFFSVGDDELDRYALDRWAKPLLPRIRHAAGLVYSSNDQAATRRAGARAWLLDFAAAGPDPLGYEGPAEYLALGESRGLPSRYKCRIREPWYRVPHIEKGTLMMSKRSHRLPRVILNQASVYTTDTIYRGCPLPDAPVTSRGLSASFHNSLTLLTAEIEGRSFGGGVLELVPSEIARLAIPVAPEAEAWLSSLDGVTRASGEEALVEATDQALVSAGATAPDVMEELAHARQELVARRLARNQRSTAVVGDAVGGQIAA